MNNNKEFTLLPLSDQEIKEKGYPLADLWLFRDKTHKLYGPLHTHYVQEKIKENSDFFIEGQICNLDSETWTPIFKTEPFQRRTQGKLHSANYIGNTFYLMINSQKNGPYSEQEVKNLLQNQQIQRDAQASVDHGSTWFKLYEHPNFDRRASKTNQELPFRPAPEVLNFVDKAKEEILKIKEEEEAIIELAFIGHNKSEEDKVEHLNESHNDETLNLIDFPTQSQKQKRLPIKKLGFVAGLFAIIALFMTFQDSPDSDSKSGETITETKSINNTSRSLRRKPASIKKTVERSATKPQKNIVKAKKYVAPKRSTRTQVTRSKPRRPARRINSRRDNPDAVRQENERLDINDPAFQEEMSRRLAGDYDLNEEQEDYPEDNREQDPYANEQEYNEELPIDDYRDDYQEDMPQDSYQDERQEDY